MSRSLFCTLTLTIALAAGASAANAAGYDSGWQEQVAYRSSSTVSYDDTSYSAPRVVHRARVAYTNSDYVVRRRATIEPCH